MSVLDLRTIAAAGGNLEISVRGFSVLDLRTIASSGAARSCRLTLRDAGTLSTLDARAIAASNPGNVTFVF
jgi:hypothetical protein